MSHPFVMHLIIHMFNTSVIPYISLEQYLSPNLYTILNMQNMRFFCCSVYNVMQIAKSGHEILVLREPYLSSKELAHTSSFVRAFKLLLATES